MFGALLSFHVSAGTAALLSAAVALATTKGDRAHVVAGRIFAAGMAVVFATAVPITIIRPNPFLFLIAVFSFYLVFSGWMRVRNRTGIPTALEWVAAATMVPAAVAMCVQGLGMVRGGDGLGVALVVFGAIGGAYAAVDLWSLRGRRYRGSVRIADHLSRMLAGAIAAVTAFTVVNVRLEPAVLVWLAPTVVLTPVIVYWNVRVLRGGAASAAPTQPKRPRA